MKYAASYAATAVQLHDGSFIMLWIQVEIR